MAQQIDFYVDQGCDFSQTFVAKDYSGSVINLTNFTIGGSFSTSNTDLYNLQNFSTIVISTPASGAITVTLSHQDSQLLFPDYRYLYSIWVISNTPSIIKVAEGIIFVRGTINAAG